nr:MAG TPA: hypothetical protein [Caudoviricetes sp.]
MNAVSVVYLNAILTNEVMSMENVWQYDKFTRGVGPVSQDDDQSYGMVLPIAYVEFDEDESVQLRNAKLIAAAPQMLKALQFVQPWLTNCDDEALHLVDEAIEKALK